MPIRFFRKKRGDVVQQPSPVLFSDLLTSKASLDIPTVSITQPQSDLFDITLLESEAIRFLLEKEVARVKRYQRQMGLFLFSCHLADVSLLTSHQLQEYRQRCALIIGRRLRIHDYLGIWADTQLLCILPETDLEQSIFVAGEMMQELEKEFLSSLNVDDTKLTMHFGVNHYGVIPVTAGQLMQQTELALQKSIEQGGNRVSVYQTE
ncbi:hypothetical protein ACMYR3_07645 [Ampullimonas aquatilis]|uniref:hypothetical protein n=1 Tax=Ampullimonas aquatilis TaxID=1341549 RepID=UPI003C733587